MLFCRDGKEREGKNKVIDCGKEVGVKENIEFVEGYVAISYFESLHMSLARDGSGGELFSPDPSVYFA